MNINININIDDRYVNFFKRMAKSRRVRIQLLTLLIGIPFALQAAPVTKPYTFTANTVARAAEVNANFDTLYTKVNDSDTRLTALEFPTKYTAWKYLNNSSILASTTWTKVGTGTHTFTKTRSDTKLEVIVNSRFGAGTFATATAVMFQIRVNDVSTSSISNDTVITTSGATEFLSMYSIFTGVAAGSHTVSVWASTNAGTSSGVLADPGGWGGGILVKETL